MPNNEQQETSYPIYNQYIYKNGIGWVLVGGGGGGEAGAAITINDTTVSPSTSINLNELVINRVTKAQYNAIANPSPNELYLITDDTIYAELVDLPQPSNNPPEMDGTASGGVETSYSRSDHIHPTDTSRAPLASPAFTGTPTAPTAAAGTNTTQLATTAFVKTAVDNLSFTATDVGAIPNTHIVANITAQDIAKWDTEETFIATYGTTTLNDISAAFNSGKIVIVKNTSDKTFALLTSLSSSAARFNFVTSEGCDYYQVNSSNTWSNGRVPFVPTTRTVNNKALSANIALDASDVGAMADDHPAAAITAQDIANWNTNEVFIATYGTTTFNDIQTAYNAGKAIFAKNTSTNKILPLVNYTGGSIFEFRNFSGNAQGEIFSVDTSNTWSFNTFSFVPTSRKVNNKALSSDITLNASDVGAMADTHDAAVITSIDIANWNAKPSVDELVKQTPLNGANSGKPLIFANTTNNTLEQTNSVYYSGNIYYNDYDKRLHIKGSNTGQDLSLGAGLITFNQDSSNRGSILLPTLSGQIQWTMPNATGTLALESNIPSSLSDLTNDPGFITTPNIPYLTCETAADTATKTTTLVSGSFGSTDLVAGAQVLVKFTNTNEIANPTISINGTTAKSIKRYGTTAPGTSAASSWNAGAVVMLVYDGTYWQMEAFMNTTYSGMSDAEVTAGTGENNRLITPARLKTAIQTWAMPYNHDAAEITSTDIANWDAKVSDDHKWNDVALNKISSIPGNSTTIYVPYLMDTNGTSAQLMPASATPSPKQIPLYWTDGTTSIPYLFSSTPAVHDASTKVATTDFVTTELSYIDGLPDQTNNAGKFLKTNGTTASWTSIDTLLDYKGVKSTAAQLPSSNNVTGDVWLVSEDNSEYIWNGTTWEKFGPTIDLSGYVPTSRTINGNALTGNITLNASDVHAVPDSAPAAGILAADINAWNAKPSVDELVKQVPLNGANSGRGLLFSSNMGNSTTTSTVATTSKLMYNDNSSSNALTIYNSDRTKYSDWTYSSLSLGNSSNTYRGMIIGNTSLTANVSYTLPSSSGTLALVSQIPLSLSDLPNDPGYATITIVDWTA